MTELRITHVSGAFDYAKIHRLLVPASGLMETRGRKLACGRTFRPGDGAAGWTDYPEGRDAMCRQCKR